jgi:hypothetical protein
MLIAYGTAIENHARSGAVVSDESKLPAPKAAMREALFTLIVSTQDRTQREQLKTSYVLLAEFQPEGGAEVIKFDVVARPGETVQEQAARFVAQGPLAMQWHQRVTEDMKALLKDLTDAKL